MNFNTLFSAVSNISGNTFVGFDSLAPVKLKGGKSNPHQGRVQKRITGATIQVFENKNVNGYEAMIKRRLIEEGKSADDFQLGERAWGKRIPNMPIVEHTKDNETKYYLEGIFHKSGKVEYLLDGAVVDSQLIEGLETKSVSTGQGGLENKVVIRTFDAAHIVELRVNGNTYS